MSSETFYSLDRPLHLLPGQGQVRNANLHRFSELVSSFGGDPRKLLEEHGLYSQFAAGDDSFLDCRPVVDLLESCAQRLNQPLFGIQLARLQQPDVYGSITALCRASPNLRVAIQCLVDFIPVLHSSESVLELVEGPRYAEFRWSERNDMGVNHQATFHGLLINMKVLRMLGTTRFSPGYVNLPMQLESDCKMELEKALGCSVRYGAGCIAFPIDALNLSVPSANEPLFRLLYSYMSQLRQIPGPSLLDRVNLYVREMLTHGDVSVEGCAQRLDISTRTLQLRLRQEGLSYSDILDQCRLVRAKAALKDASLSIAQVADLLGYSERTSFGRAFKRWTGQSPQQFREFAVRTP